MSDESDKLLADLARQVVGLAQDNEKLAEQVVQMAETQGRLIGLVEKLTEDYDRLNKRTIRMAKTVHLLENED